jgi:hypothetical protein
VSVRIIQTQKIKIQDEESQISIEVLDDVDGRVIVVNEGDEVLCCSPELAAAVARAILTITSNKRSIS